MNHLLKGTLQTIVLRLLEENGRMYGYQITQKVKEMSDGEFTLTEGALYPTLHKLEAEELLTATFEQVDGRLRKYYSLTPKGNVEVKEKIFEMENFLEKIQWVLNLKMT